MSFCEGERDWQVSLVENFRHEDLDPIDAARGLKAIEEFDLTKPQLAEQVGMSVTWVSERLRLLSPPRMQRNWSPPEVVPCGRPSACCLRSPKSRFGSSSAIRRMGHDSVRHGPNCPKTPPKYR